MDKVSLLAGWAAFGLLLLLYIPIHLWLSYRKKGPKNTVAVRSIEKLSVERMYGIAKNPASSLDQLQAVADSLANSCWISSSFSPPTATQTTCSSMGCSRN